MQLAFDEQAIDSTRSRLGFQISNNVNTGFGSVRPMFSAEWFHEFEDAQRAIRAKYATEDDLAGQGNFTAGFGEGCVSCFDIISEKPETDYFVVGLGIAATTQRGLQSFLMVEGLLGHDYLSAYALTLGLRGQF
jgi:outer membrane autotransporter protein